MVQQDMCFCISTEALKIGKNDSDGYKDFTAHKRALFLTFKELLAED